MYYRNTSPSRNTFSMATTAMSWRIVVGGGISGVCCAQELARLNPKDEIVIVTASETLLEAKSVFAWSKYLEEIDIFEKTADQFVLSNPNIRIVEDLVDFINPDSHTIHLKKSNTTLTYSQLCLCTGVRPKLIAEHDRIVGIRDLFSVHCLVDKLKSARKVVVVGNGGIALELIHELKCFDLHWVIREAYVGAAFFDESASDFIMPTLLARDPSRLASIVHNSTSSDTQLSITQQPIPSHNPATATTTSSSFPAEENINISRNHLPGSGLGPAWLTKTKFHDYLSPEVAHRQGYLQLHFNSEIGGFSDDNGHTWHWLLPAYQLQLQDRTQRWFQENQHMGKTLPLLVITTLGEVIECDLIISATGVQPNHGEILSPLITSSSARLSVDTEGFIFVNNRFQTSLPDIFAAGDCCHYQPFSSTNTQKEPRNRLFQPPHFFQMKLWTQARIMGTYVAQCMCSVEDDYGIDQHLELFAHVTRFFGLKVVLLGRYNAQGAGDVIEQVAKRTVLVSATVDDQHEKDENKDEGRNNDSNAIKRPKLNHSDSHSNISNDNNNELCDLEIWSRITPGKQFIKLIVYRGKIVGALLIGDTEMEEVFENLILNQLDISSLGQALLDPDLDLADYFD